MNTTAEEKNGILLGGISPRCYECSRNQARVASRFAGLDEKQTAAALKVSEDSLEESKTSPLLVQHVCRRVSDKIIEEKNLPAGYDLYRDVKKLSNDLALKMAPKLKKDLSESSSPLEFGLQIAAAGNIIDFGAKEYGSFDIEEELEKLHETAFDRFDFKELNEAIQNAETMLYLCDNCGEIVFDRILIELLKKLYPHLKITAAFRETPILNDAVIEDARYVGLHETVPLISSGSVYPGTVLPETTDDFKARFAEADIIISKGQGNFETLLPLKDPRIFFILRIKCDYMSDLSGVPEGSLVLMKGDLGKY